MNWIHGELIDKNNVVFQFRYSFKDNIEQVLRRIVVKYQVGSEIL